MTVQTPIPDFAAAREAMVESQLRPQGVTDPAVLRRDGRASSASGSCRQQTRPLAYVDRAVAIGDGRFLPAPAVLGQLLTQMMPEAGQRALVVGAGTGYSAAVLAAMGLEVVALESDRDFAAGARAAGRRRRRGPARERATTKGAPYDQILIDGAVEQSSRRDRRSARRRRPPRRGACRPRDHAAGRRPQGRRRVRLSFHRRCGGSGAAGLHSPASHSHSKGAGRVHRKLLTGDR